MRRVLVLLGVVALLGAAAPAWAHEEINPKTFPTGKPTFFTLSAANEEKVDLTKVTLTAPTDVAFGSTTKEPPSWAVNKSDTQITWTGGAVKPDEFENWGYEIEGADQPGTLKYKVTLGFADGKSDDVEVDVTAVSGSAANGTVTVKKSGGGGKANVALGLGAGAVALSLVALAFGAGRRRAPASSGERQDW